MSIVSLLELGGGRFSLPLAFGLLLLPAIVCADTKWTGSVDGDFNTSGNWTDGVPTAANAGVIDKTGDNAIAVSTAPADKAGFLSISNADGTTTLSVTAPMELEGGRVTIGTNSEVVVGTGGEWIMDLTGAAAANSTEMFGIHNGGKFTIDGGLVSFTNTTGALLLGTNKRPGDEATFEIKGGKFIYSYTVGEGTKLGPGATFKMTGGRLESRTFCRSFVGYGGTIDLSGDAQMFFVDPANASERDPHLLLGGLTLRMSGSSCLKYSAALPSSGNFLARRWYINATDTTESKTIVVDMSDNSFMSFRDDSDSGRAINGGSDVCCSSVSVGKGNTGTPTAYIGTAIVRMSGNAGIESAEEFRVGAYGGSTGIVEMADSSFIVGGERLTITKGIMRLGCEGVAKEVPAVGILKMSGGLVKLRSVGYSYDGHVKRNKPYGLIVGDGTKGDYEGNVSIGHLEMTGGSITNLWQDSASSWSAFMLGARSARGEIVQSGGEIVHCGNLPLVIGFSGGEGVYDMAGGRLEIPESQEKSVSTRWNIYVGGASIADAGYNPVITTDGKYAEWQDRLSTGVFTVSGGVARTVGSIYVSSHGYGTLEIGKGGNIEAANLYLTNSTVDGVTAPAKLKVTLGAEGCGMINLSGTCQIAADAECEIDVSAFEQGGERRKIPFLACESVEGGFDSANVTVTGNGADSFKLVHSDTGLSVEYSGRKGLVLIVR